MELELLVLFVFHSLGVAVFGHFEVETAWWRLLLKWIILLLITWSLYVNFGHSITLITLAVLFIAAVIFHFTWCYKHHIHPIKATPRKKYYELRKWKWEE